MLTEELLNRQIDMELRAKERGIARFNDAFTRAQESGRGQDTEGGVFLIKQAVKPVADGISAYLDRSLNGGAGRRAVAAVILKDIDVDLLAYVTMSNIVSALALYRSRPVSAVATAIARALEMELKMAAFDEQKPSLYTAIMSRLKDTGSTQEHTAKVMRQAIGKYGVEWDGWNVSERILLGAALVETAVQATGFAELEHVRVGHNKFSYIMRPSAEIVAWLEDRNEKASAIRPLVLPMIVPPREWKGLRGGGYRSDHILKAPLVKRMGKAHAEHLKGADLETTLVGLNAIQATAWCINRPVYDVARSLWELGRELPGDSQRDTLDIPDKPEDIDTNEDARRAWREAAKAVHEANAKSRSGRLLTAHILDTAGELRDEAAIFFPHALDFRGRCYARPHALNPQGTDLAKAMLTFANGKPLGDDRAVGWLAIHGANSFGMDKVSHAERIDWVYDNEDAILAVAEDPLGNAWWHEADAPWAFLSFCLEWAGYREHGLKFVSSLPIPLDGSCNGIQHYSAMLRDPVGGAAVNLTLMDEDKPQDIYAAVARVVLAKLEKIATDPDSDKAWVAGAWLAFGIDRKMTKRQVMVLPYGGTRNSCVKYTQKAVQERIAKGVAAPFGMDELPQQSMWLGGVIWDAIGETVVAARDAMGWLQKVARVATVAGVPLTWTTPTGFVAFQAYKETKERLIKTRINGSIVRFAHNEETDKLAKYKQPLGIAPNFVHSLDAAAMMLTVRTAVHNGVGSFAMIHDSYGTLAADTDMLGNCLRHAFHDMYTDHDVLERFRDEIAAQLPPEAVAKLPPLPAKGSLDLSGVLESPFFFS